MLLPIIIVLVNIVSFTISFILSTNKVLDNRSKGLKKLTKNGRAVIFLGILIISLPIIQYKISENNQKEKEHKSLLEAKIKDSISHSENEKNKERIIQVFTEALARYGLKYDSTQLIIKKLIKDSSKKTIIQNENTPNFDFSNDDGIQLLSKQIGEYNFKVSTYSFESSTSNLDAHITIVNKNVDGKFAIGAPSIRYSTLNANIPINTKYGMEFKYKSIDNIDIIYFVLKGHYTNTSGTKTILLNSIRGFDLVHSKYIGPSTSDAEQISNLLEKSNIFLK